MEPAHETLQLDIEPLLDQFAQAVERETDLENTSIIGIHRGGVWLVQWLVARFGIDKPTGSLDISFYRDDFSARGLQPEVKPSDIPFQVDDAHILLIDDVMLSGRTTRAALNEIFDYGRPASIRYACLIDLDKRQLPLRPDICASTMHLADNQRIELSGPKPLGLARVTIAEKSK